MSVLFILPLELFEEERDRPINSLDIELKQRLVQPPAMWTYSCMKQYITVETEVDIIIVNYGGTASVSIGELEERT